MVQVGKHKSHFTSGSSQEGLSKPSGSDHKFEAVAEPLPPLLLCPDMYEHAERIILMNEMSLSIKCNRTVRYRTRSPICKEWTARSSQWVRRTGDALQRQILKSVRRKRVGRAEKNLCTTDSLLKSKLNVVLLSVYFLYKVVWCLRCLSGLDLNPLIPLPPALWQDSFHFLLLPDEDDDALDVQSRVSRVCVLFLICFRLVPTFCRRDGTRKVSRLK